MDSRNRRCMITLRLSADERGQINREAEELGISTNTYIRRRLGLDVVGRIHLSKSELAEQK